MLFIIWVLWYHAAGCFFFVNASLEHIWRRFFMGCCAVIVLLSMSRGLYRDEIMDVLERVWLITR